MNTRTVLIAALALWSFFWMGHYVGAYSRTKVSESEHLVIREVILKAGQRETELTESECNDSLRGALSMIDLNLQFMDAWRFDPVDLFMAPVAQPMHYLGVYQIAGPRADENSVCDQGQILNCKCDDVAGDK